MKQEKPWCDGLNKYISMTSTSLLWHKAKFLGYLWTQTGRQEHANTHTNLYSWYCEVWDFKFDSNGGFAFELIVLHTGQAKMSPH